MSKSMTKLYSELLSDICTFEKRYRIKVNVVLVNDKYKDLFGFIYKTDNLLKHKFEIYFVKMDCDYRLLSNGDHFLKELLSEIDEVDITKTIIKKFESNMKEIQNKIIEYSLKFNHTPNVLFVDGKYWYTFNENLRNYLPKDYYSRIISSKELSGLKIIIADIHQDGNNLHRFAVGKMIL